MSDHETWVSAPPPDLTEDERKQLAQAAEAGPNVFERVRDALFGEPAPVPPAYPCHKCAVQERQRTSPYCEACALEEGQP